MLYCKVHVSFITSILEDEHELSLGMLMHVKCIHELCTITPIFQSYLHHINFILLLFNDFWKEIMIFYFYEINSAQAEYPLSFLLCFRGLNDVIMTCKIKGVNILEGGRHRSKGSRQTEAGVPKEWGPCGPCTWPRGTHPNGPRGSAAIDLFSTAFILT